MLVCMAALSGRIESQVRLADIVYANDQSGSMSLNYVWISPDGADTVYLSSTDGCPGYYNSSDLSGFGTLTVPSQSGTRMVPRINPAKNPDRCGNGSLSGDPFSQRALAFREAIDYQAIRAPESQAGYLGFAQYLAGTTPPLPLNSAANINAIKNYVSILNSGATNYLIALDQAKKWLTAPTLSPNPAKAVIFLSDGQPNTPSYNSHLQVLSESYAAAPGTMPPIYGIFLGKPRPDTASLHELAIMTGGRFFLVPSHLPDSLSAVMKRIIDIILDPGPSTRTMSNRGEYTPNPTASPSRSGYACTDLLGRARESKRPGLSK